MSKDSGDHGSNEGSGDSVSRGTPNASSCSITSSMASLSGDGVSPSTAPGDGGQGDGILGVWYPVER